MLLAQGIHLAGIYVFNKEKDSIENISIYDLSELTNSGQNPEMMLSLPLEQWLSGIYIFFQRFGIAMYVLQNSLQVTLESEYIDHHIDDLLQCYENFHDEESRLTFRSVLLARMSGQNMDYCYATEPQYMLWQFMPRKGDIAIDGGALDGETAREFSSLGAKVYSFEMDEANFNRCIEPSRKYGFIVENMGLSSCCKKQRYFAAKGGSCVNENGEHEANFVSIDSYAVEHNLPRVDYIKLDIEGSELEALKGAAMSITKFKPRMAISAYHRKEDLYELQKYIKSLRPDYEFCLRHYKNDLNVGTYAGRTDMKNVLQNLGLSTQFPSVWEIVLYCK